MTVQSYSCQPPAVVFVSVDSKADCGLLGLMGSNISPALLSMIVQVGSLPFHHDTLRFDSCNCFEAVRLSMLQCLAL